MAAKRGFSKKLLDRWKADANIREKRSRNYYVVELRDCDKVRTDIVHVGDIKPYNERQQDQIPHRGDALVRLQLLDPEEQVEIPDVLHDSDLNVDQTSDKELTEASFEDVSDDEGVPEGVAPAIEPKFSSRGRRLPPPIDRYGEWRSVRTAHCTILRCQLLFIVSVGREFRPVMKISKKDSAPQLPTCCGRTDLFRLTA